MVESNATVYVVDDDPPVLRSIGRLVSSVGFHIEAFLSAKEFLQNGINGDPSCLVLDVRLPGLNGFDLQKELDQRQIHIPIVFITGYGDIPMAVEAMKDGAVDFLPKPFDDKTLLGAIDRAIDKDIQAKKRQSEIDEIQQRVDTLTPREYEVMRWVLTGMLNKQIASELGIVEKTIKVHRGRVMEKMQVVSVAELVRLTQKVGITPPEV